MSLAPPQGPSPWSVRRFHGVQTRLALSFGLWATLILVTLLYIGLFGVPLTPYQGRAGDFRAQAAAGVQLIADYKEERVRWWFDQRQKNLHLWADYPWRRTQVQKIMKAVERLTAEGLRGPALWARLQEQPDHQALTSRLDELCRTYPDYRRIFVVAAKSGIVLASTDKADLGADVSGEPYVTRPARKGGDFAAALSLAGKEPEPILHLARAMLSPQGATIAVLVAEIRIAGALQPLLQAEERPAAHAETLLIDSGGRLLAALGHPAAGGGQLQPQPDRLDSEAAKLALQHRRGVVESVDDRGLPVLAAYRFIGLTPELGWGLVVQRDRDEVFAPLRGEIFRAVMVGVLGVVLIVLAAAGLARRIARPMQAMARAAEQVSRGDLTARAPVMTTDELGALARTFNDMVQRIADWQEALVRQERLATLGQVTATVSHELRNPLGAIRISFFVIGQRLRDKGLGIEPALERIERSITRCENIINDLLDYSRDRPMQRCPTEIDPWLASLLEKYELPAGIVLCRRLAAAAAVALDREHFRRCMLNLLNNACQAMDGAAGRLTVASGVEDGRLAIRVADTGCGIPSDQLPQIFAPLFSTKNFGVGLGLPLVKQIVSGHEGSVEVQSQPGQGTTVTLWLPVEAGRKKE